MKLILVNLILFIVAECVLLKINDTSTIVFIYGKHQKHRQSYPTASISNVLNHHKFNKSKLTLLYVHGFNETFDNYHFKTIQHAYLTRGDHNILMMNWCEMSAKDYFFHAIPNAVLLSRVVADSILIMVKNGLDIPSLHVVGHSLGCQLSSLAARRIIKLSKGKIKLSRLTGLDPAFPFFYPNPILGHLSKNDATMVDVIHTDAWIYGAPIDTGTVDFYPNQGTTLQPGCNKRHYEFFTELDACSHWRSYQFWAESVAAVSKTFHSSECKSWSDFVRRKCLNNKIISMGIDCPHDAKGKYFLQTNARIPFSQGILGIIYTKNVL